MKARHLSARSTKACSTCGWRPTAASLWSIRIISDMIAALLGAQLPTEGVGHKPVELCTVLTDGSVEPTTCCGLRATASRDQVQHFRARDRRGRAPYWKAARGVNQPSQKCQQCKFMNACGGGYLPHRFSRKNGYDNPSVYCDDLYSMFENMESVLAGHLYVSKPDGERLDVRDALAGA
jgi:uncharacterized protein